MKAILNRLTMASLSAMANSGKLCHTIGNHHITLADNGQLSVYDQWHNLVFDTRLNINLLKRKNACA